MVWKTPLEMPTMGASVQQYELQRVDYQSPEANGRVSGVQAGIPLWMGVWNFGRMTRDKSDELRAFWLRIRGQQRRFLGRDLARPYPKAHITGFTGMVRAGTSDPFDGSATDWSENAALDGDRSIVLDGLPAGLTLSIGDYIGFRWTSSAETGGLEWTTVVRCVETVTANGVGHLVVTTEPPLPTVVPVDAVAYLDRPACVMAMIGDKSSLEGVDRLLVVRGGTLTAIQDLRP